MIDTIHFLHLTPITEIIVKYLLIKVLLVYANELVRDIQDKKNSFDVKEFEEFIES